MCVLGEPIKRVLWVLLTVAAVVECGYLVGSGRLSYALAAFVLAILPLAAYVMLARPYIFPYGLYVALIPFDTLLKIPAFGSASKLVGLVSGGALLLYALRLKRFNPPPVTVLVWALYGTWAAATIMWAIDPRDAATGAATIAQLFLLYTIVAMTPVTKDDLRVVVGVAVIGAVIAGAYGGWVFYHQQSSVVAQVQTQLQRLQFQNGDLSVDQNHFADSLIFPAVALIVWTFKSRVPLHKAIFSAALAVIVGGIYFSGSRETLVALGIVIVYLLIAAPRYRLQIAVVAGFAAALSVAAPLTWQRFGEASMTGGSGRLSIWHTGLLAASDYWLHGAGLSNFGEAYNGRYLQVYQTYQAGWGRAAHDIVLSTVVELGVIGLVLLIAAFVAQFRLLSGIGQDDELYDYKLIVNGSLLGIIVVAFFIDLMTYKYIWFAMATMTQVYAAWAQRRPIVAERSSGPLRTSILTTS